MRRCKKHFLGKVVYCNCDDPRVSNFFHYFSHRFEALGLKKPIAACCKSRNPNLSSQNDSEQAIRLEYDGDKDGNRVPDTEEIGIFPLQCDGDFRSAECIELLRQADIVCTNPPFSLFREYVAQLVEYGKKFLILGNLNAISYKEIFPLIRDGQMWLGMTSGSKEYAVPERYAGKISRIDDAGTRYVKMGNTAWLTNLDLKRRREDLLLWKPYSPEAYPKYDNYDAIEIGKTKEIPKDYAGVMGVPISFLDKHNPEQFEIIGATESEGKGFSAGLWAPEMGTAQAMVNGEKAYKRLFIRNRRLQGFGDVQIESPLRANAAG